MNKLIMAFLALVLIPRIALPEPGVPFDMLQEQIDVMSRRIDLLGNRVLDLEHTFTVVCASDGTTRFVDNGDGTICDTETGLMWEKKDAADGVEDFSNPHDVDNRYTWTTVSEIPGEDVLIDFTDPDGTVFTDFLARLNNTLAGSPGDIPLAKHTDWRIPTFWELKTIHVGGSCSPCWFPEFVPTNGQVAYWSMTTSASDPGDAWVLFFGEGFLEEDEPKAGIARPVRAVRGPVVVLGR